MLSAALRRGRARSCLPSGNERTRFVVASKRWNSNASTKPVVANRTRTIYNGPLTNTFKYLKIFSLSSLALSSALSPFIFILESSLPFSGRVFLAATAISTTSLSTWLISTFTSPYVTSILAHGPSSPFSHTLTTTSLFLRPLRTKIKSPSILVSSERPLTTWKLPETLPGAAEDGMGLQTLAWTEDEAGKRLGNWTVDARGACKTEGKVVKYFHVHKELLAEEMDPNA